MAYSIIAVPLISGWIEKKSMKKQNAVAMIICVVIAFIIWLIISNINLKANTPATLPLVDNGGSVVVMDVLK